MRCSCLPNEHQVQDTFVLLPVGTIDCGTRKHDLVGKVLSDSIAPVVLACGRGGIHPRP